MRASTPAPRAPSRPRGIRPGGRAPRRWERILALVAAVALAAPPVHAHGQIPESFKNLKVLPADIGRDSLVMLMRSFTFATGLRCDDCHVMGEGGSFVGASFDLDDKLPKRQARVMLRMVNSMNEEILPELPGRADPPLLVECKTCHRGIRRPFLLRTELRSIVEKDGAEAAIQRYRDLRSTATLDGTYDFGVWEMNELARELARDGRVQDAAAMLELNEEFNPTEASIPGDLGPLYERLGASDEAIAAYRRALELNPDDARSASRLRALAPGGGEGTAPGGPTGAARRPEL